MPPNRKTNIDLVEGVASLNLHNHVAKFAPLTSESPANTKLSPPADDDQQDEELHEDRRIIDESDKYWEWDADPKEPQKCSRRRMMDESKGEGNDELVIGGHLLRPSVPIRAEDVMGKQIEEPEELHEKGEDERNPPDVFCQRYHFKDHITKGAHERLT